MPLFALGFRPLFLSGSVFGALSVLLWVLQLAGVVRQPWLAGSLWHAHEMIFGFAMAIVAGFLLTAVRNWTGRPTLSGPALALLVAAWLLARVAVLAGPWWLATGADQAFLLGLALAIGRPLWQTRNRNRFLVALLLAFAASELVFRLALRHADQALARLAIHAALDLVLLLMSVIGGRVIPLFTNNALPGTGATNLPVLDRLALGSVAVLLAADLMQAGGAGLAAVCLVGAGAHGARWLRWHPWATRGTPLLWVLHLGYAWIPLHLALRAGAAVGRFPASDALHALSAGAIGTLILAMVSRVARGHTGNPLQADGGDIVGFVLVIAAGAVRSLGPAVLPDWRWWAVDLAGGLWAAAFLLFAWRYAPMLCRPRPDGKPG